MTLLVKFLQFLAIILHTVSNKILNTILEWYLGENQICPSIKNDKFIMKSAIEIASMIRERKITSFEVVKAYIDRINSINPILNAIIDGPFEMDAIEMAKMIDNRLENGEFNEDELRSMPFLGVPFTTKDSTAVKGKLHTLGLLSRKNTRAVEDAECVRLMKSAGAIVIATTNVPEVNKWIETRSSVKGQTVNPYDTRRSVGGSSGGEACLVSACGTAIGIGTDIGGSIRIPAFCCGVYGHKSTTGVVNMRGCTARTGNEEISMVTAGPITRYASDLKPIMKVLMGSENSERLKLDEYVDVKKLRYFYATETGNIMSNPVSSESQVAMNKVIEYLSVLSGKQPEPTRFFGMDKAMKMWYYRMKQESATLNYLFGNGRQLNVFVEIFKKLIGQGEFTMAAIYNLIAELLPNGNEKKEQLQELIRKCEEAFNQVLGDDGVLIFHGFPRGVPLHYYNLIKLHDFQYFTLFNVLDVPVTQVPVGLDSQGLPIGIQIVSTKKNDRYCLAVAEAIESGLGGWVAPFTLKE